MTLRCGLPAMAAALLLGACAGHNSTDHASATTVRSAPAATTRTSGFHPVSAGTGMPPAGRREARVPALVKAVFMHPQSAQCTSVMTSHYVAEAFGAEAMRSGISPMRDCRQHQRLRAAMDPSLRRITVGDVVSSWPHIQVTVRGANGYPIGVTLVLHGDRWLLDGFGSATLARGHGPQVSPTGSLYAYRIPPGFVPGGTQIGPVGTTGAAFSTSVVLPGGRSDGGVAVAQTAIGSGIHDRAALQAALPALDRGVRSSLVARFIEAPVPGEIAGRLAASWNLIGEGPTPAQTDGRTVFVFSSGADLVIVNCRWPHSGPDRTVMQRGCNTVLGTISVG